MDSSVKWMAGLAALAGGAAVLIYFATRTSGKPPVRTRGARTYRLKGNISPMAPRAASNRPTMRRPGGAAPTVKALPPPRDEPPKPRDPGEPSPEDDEEEEDDEDEGDEDEEPPFEE